MRISNFKLGVAIPLSFHYVHSAFFDSFLMMEKPEWLFFRASNGPLEEMRNNIVRNAKTAACSHLLMMDTDQVYPPDTIKRMLSHNLPVVGALVFRRYPPFDPLMLKGQLNGYQTIDSWEPGSLVEVDATGTGCILYNMEVFDKIPEPWFKFRMDENEHQIGEDIGFCSELRNAGYKIYVDTAVEVDHLSMLAIGEGTWKLYRRMKEAEAKANEIKDGIMRTEEIA